MLWSWRIWLKVITLLKNQFERSATGIGANIREANYAQSKADFLSKLQIALKECNESEYWLWLLYETNSLTEAEFQNFYGKCVELRRMLVSSVTTLKCK